jgi:hypothetical protein
VPLTGPAIFVSHGGEAFPTGRSESQVIEESLLRDMGLDVLERLWERNDVPEKGATALAVEARHRTRPPRR